jgi:hypothetical protein
MSTKLLASSATLQGITKLISEYFLTDNIEIREYVIGGYGIYKNGIYINDYRVVKRGRYRFEILTLD